MLEYILGGVAGLVLGALGVIIIRKIQDKGRISASKAESERIIEEARLDAVKIRAETKEEILKKKEEADQEIIEQRREVSEERKQLAQTERRLQKREDELDSRSSKLEKRELRVNETTEKADKTLAEAESYVEKQKAELYNISQLNRDAARDMLLKKLESELADETQKIINKQEQMARDTGEEKAREILVSVIERHASDFVCENTVSTVKLADDEMKGRIIGREGRNIRALEKETGLNIIVDDTPGVVVLSGFDPIRRETARLALEKLLTDGRIHPTRIEEAVAKANEKLELEMAEIGKKTAQDLGLGNLPNKLKLLMGRLKYRTSYGQNVLQHSIDVARISEYLAGELKLNAKLARRAGYLHDIGKAVDQDQEGTHPELGMKLVQQAGERPEVCEAVGGHHHDIPVHSLYPEIVHIADAISAARPGARIESLERYIRRMKELEDIAMSYPDRKSVV